MSNSSVITLDPTVSSQRHWLDVVQSSPESPRSAVIRTFSSSNGSTCAGELTADFYRSLDSLHALPNLSSVSLHFSPYCLGAESDREGSAFPLMSGALERTDRRIGVLRAFFEATAAHRRVPGDQRSRIRTVTVKNLQNTARNEEITASEPFMETVKDVDALHLHVCTEWSEENLWAIEEMQSFWPQLRSGWLDPVARQLQSLTLYCDNLWGVFPPFDTEGLAFPNLKSLSLGCFVFGLDGQLDWLTSQKALEHLSLDGCAICSRWEVEDDAYEGDDPRSSLARQLRVVRPYDADDPDGLEWWVLGYDGLWSRYFERIARELPRLREFHFSSEWHPRGDAPGGSMPDRRTDAVFDNRMALGVPALDAEKHPRYLSFTIDGYEPTTLPDPEDVSLTGPELDQEEQRALDNLLYVARTRT